ncbi:nucleotidyltransferase domain-containing protein [Leptolyngbya sp. AN03gr2]|uniref:nucleotidyltransferase domain-containing protein n=1 Tax=unclassified Leptolyngbya TaxID=2650499 RepID=UPI003D314D8A
MTHPHLDTILQQLRRSLTKLYGDRLQALILFGSQARQDAQPDSDIDVLVVLQSPVDAWAENQRTAEVIATLCLKHSAVITPVFISDQQFRASDTALLRNIQHEGVQM